VLKTRTFIRRMDEDFGIAAAATAWQEGEIEDPVYIRAKL